MTEQEVEWITDTENSRLSFKSLELLYDLQQLFS